MRINSAYRGINKLDKAYEMRSIVLVVATVGVGPLGWG